MLKALLFDVDGTLADTERDGHRVAFNRAFDQAGLDWFWDEELYGELLAVTGGKERMKHFVKTHRPDADHDDLSEQIINLQSIKTKHYTELLSTGQIPLRPGVERLILEAKNNGIRLGIVTTTTPENVTALLTHTLGKESVEWFDVIAAGDVVPAKKPAPDIYHYALNVMGLNPSDCLALEDSFNGIRSATAAQLPTLITVNGYTVNDDFSGAALVLSSLGEPEGESVDVFSGAFAKPYVSLEDLIELHRQSIS